MPVIPQKSKLYFVRNICSFSSDKYKKVDVHVASSIELSV